MAARWRSPPESIAGILCVSAPGRRLQQRAAFSRASDLRSALPKRSCMPRTTLSSALRGNRARWSHRRFRATPCRQADPLSTLPVSISGDRRSRATRWICRGRWGRMHRLAVSHGKSDDRRSPRTEGDADLVQRDDGAHPIDPTTRACGGTGRIPLPSDYEMRLDFRKVKIGETGITDRLNGLIDGDAACDGNFRLCPQFSPQPHQTPAPAADAGARRARRFAPPSACISQAAIKTRRDRPRSARRFERVNNRLSLPLSASCCHAAKRILSELDSLSEEVAQIRGGCTARSPSASAPSRAALHHAP